MGKIFLLVWIVTSSLWAIPGVTPSQGMAPVAQQIFNILKAGQKSNSFTCRKERICGTSAIPEFYRKRSYTPAWTLEGSLTAQARDLILALESSRDEGLSPEIYHFAEIQTVLAKLKESTLVLHAIPPSLLAELDILLTDAFLLYAAHLRAGRVDPESIQTSWVAFHPEVDLSLVLSEALASGRIIESLVALSPANEGYHRLKQALLSYRKISVETQWPKIPSGPTLRPGGTDARVGALKHLLKVMGDLEDSSDDGSLVFDESLEQALRRFQRRHGLEADGILGRQTLSQLNRPVAERIRQMEINLERWRWLPHDLGARYVLVNIAAFQLNVMESGRSVLDMRVVVGTDYRKTPVFSETMKYVVLNPYWDVPFRIAIEDKLPIIQKDPSYLSKNGYRVFAGWEENATEVAPESIDWSGINRSNFVYRLRQDPGPKNALGRIKFMFPNRFSVYLHDTPQQGLFQKTVRIFSSGCIRVEQPLALAAYVLQDNPDWNLEKIETVIASGNNRTIFLKFSIPVHLLYWTAWVEPDGTIHFREDVYERDQLLDRALKEVPLKTGFR